MHDDDLLADAQAAAELFTDDLIAADKQLDVISGSAGAILGLLRLYRDSRSDDVLRRAVKCGEHLLGQARLGPEGRRSWVGQGSGPRGSTACRTARRALPMRWHRWRRRPGGKNSRKPPPECIAFENSSYDAERNNWPDLRGAGGPSWPCQWCHGAPGIGLARIAIARQRGTGDARLGSRYRQRGRGRRRSGRADRRRYAVLRRARQRRILLRGRRRAWARAIFATLAARAADGGSAHRCRGRRLSLEQRQRAFNLGLFRGLAGVGYTVLRRSTARCPMC